MRLQPDGIAPLYSLDTVGESAPPPGSPPVYAEQATGNGAQVLAHRHGYPAPQTPAVERFADLGEPTSLGSDRSSGIEKVTTQDEKSDGVEADVDEVGELEPDNNGQEIVLETANDFAQRLISLDDDPTMPIHTFRMWFTGIGLAVFASVLGMLFVSSRAEQIFGGWITEYLPLAIPPAGVERLAAVSTAHRIHDGPLFRGGHPRTREQIPHRRPDMELA